MSTATAHDVIDAYLDGVTAIERIAGWLSDDDWTRPTPCAAWTAADLVGHVACTAEDYHHFLDLIIDGTDASIVHGDDIDLHNSARLRTVAHLPPIVRLVTFGLTARRVKERGATHWDRFAFSLRARPWTIGTYLGLCALEWHIHAWDLGRSIDHTYRPMTLCTLLAIWSDTFPHLPLPTGDGWTALLRASGRCPAPAGQPIGPYDKPETTRSAT